jgi:hypothetical protein
MNREYDIFENDPWGPVWRGSVVGRELALAKLAELSLRTANEVFAMYLPDQVVIARVNINAHLAQSSALTRGEKGQNAM